MVLETLQGERYAWMARYVIKFSKGYGIKFISHLDLMRTFQRAMRRANLPISYSMGFNPHAEFSFATPLSVGTWSIGEYMDIGLEHEMDEKDIVDSINSNLPPHIRIIGAKKVDDKSKSLMPIVGGALWEVTLVGHKGLNSDMIKEFLKQPEIKVEKQGKRGTRIIDIKPMILNLKTIEDNGGEFIFSLKSLAGSKNNLNPDLLVKALKAYCNELSETEIRDIKKIETYTLSDDGLISLGEFFGILGSGLYE